MGEMLSALLHLQSVERQIVAVRNRLRNREKSVASQQQRIDRVRSDFGALEEQILERRKRSDSLELDLSGQEEKVTGLRTALNTAKTNKEYAALLTQINTLKADNAKKEEEALKVMEEIDSLRAEKEKVQSQIDTEEQRLQDVSDSSKAEIERFRGMLEELTLQRTEAAKKLPPEKLALFERINESLLGDAMAPLEIHRKKPPHDYVCGGCFMALNAEHANALQTRDEIRTCDSCGRILYLEGMEAAKKQDS